jgi:hypothetical protein
VAALGLYTSLGFVREKRLHRFYLNGKDAFRLVLPLCGAKDAATSAAAASPGGTDLLKRRPSALPPPPGTSDDDDEEEEYEYDDAGRRAAAAAARMEPAPGSPSSSAGDDSEDYADDPAKLVRLRRRVAALRACRMITVWPADDDNRVSGR